MESQVSRCLFYFIFMKNLGKRPVYAKDIELEFDMRGASVTGILQLKEKNGLLKRQGTSDDGRLKNIVLTEKAEEARKKVGKEVTRVETTLVKGLSKEEVELFFMVMEKMSKNLSEISEKEREELKDDKKTSKLCKRI